MRRRTVITAARQDSTFADVIAEALQRHGDRVAFVAGERRMTYREAADVTGRFVRILTSCGVGRGSGVIGLGPNSPEVWLLQAACYLVGARFTGLHALGSLDDHAYVVDDSEATVLVVSASHAETGGSIMRRCNGLQHLLTIGPADVGRDLAALIHEVDPAPLTGHGVHVEDIAWLQYTGGTTGVPKGVMLSQRAMVQQVLSWLASAGMPQYPRYLAASPITHAAVLPVLPTLVRGGTVILQQSFSPAAFASAIAEHGVNYTLAVPTMIYELLRHLETADYDLSSLETVAYGAAPMSPARIREARKLLGPVLLQGYAQTESGGVMMTLRQHEQDGAELERLSGSCGRPAVGFVCTVLDDAGEPLPAGQIGEICTRSAAVMSGYWKQPALTDRALAGGWLHTGDLGYRDAEGFYYIVDRLKDLIISGGFNVYPKEIEDVLTGHEAIVSAAVIGVPHPKWGEQVTAYVVARNPDVDTGDLIALVRRRKGAHYAPKVIRVVEELPKTSVGKIDKKALLAAHLAGVPGHTR
jgi:fatty-acyl-CoA synthase